jgi:hypothetical protein
MVELGARVKVKYGYTIFGEKTGTVIQPVGPIWEVWVKLDEDLEGNDIFGFMEHELTVLNKDE